MTAYRFWTLTCDGCGQIWDFGTAHRMTDARRTARAHGWQTGRSQTDTDLCPSCLAEALSGVTP